MESNIILEVNLREVLFTAQREYFKHEFRRNNLWELSNIFPGWKIKCSICKSIRGKWLSNVTTLIYVNFQAVNQDWVVADLNKGMKIHEMEKFFVSWMCQLWQLWLTQKLCKIQKLVWLELPLHLIPEFFIMLERHVFAKSII